MEIQVGDVILTNNHERLLVYRIHDFIGWEPGNLKINNTMYKVINLDIVPRNAITENESWIDSIDLHDFKSYTTRTIRYDHESDTYTAFNCCNQKSIYIDDILKKQYTINIDFVKNLTKVENYEVDYLKKLSMGDLIITDENERLVVAEIANWEYGPDENGKNINPCTEYSVINDYKLACYRSTYLGSCSEDCQLILVEWDKYKNNDKYEPQYINNKNFRKYNFSNYSAVAYWLQKEFDVTIADRVPLTIKKVIPNAYKKIYKLRKNY